MSGISSPSDIVTVASTVVCPVCKSTNFSTSSSGLINKRITYRCMHCDTIMEGTGSKDNLSFQVIKVGEDYSNAATLFIDRRFKLSELGTHKLNIFTDSELEAFANGDLEELKIQMYGDKLPNIILRKNEQIAFYLSPIHYLEERRKRISSLGGSFSYRIIKGLWYHTPRFSTYRFAEQIEELDSGTFIVTNKRYIFLGSSKNIDQPFIKILAINRYTDAIGIVRSNKQRTEFYTGNYHWPFISSVLSGLVKNELSRTNN